MMDESGKIYISEDAKPEDVARLEAAVKRASEDSPEERAKMLDRMERLVSEASEDLRRYRELRL
jgi:acyl-CoA reductase-like NAD-dependent aldehyde dehydrogenase